MKVTVANDSNGDGEGEGEGEGEGDRALGVTVIVEAALAEPQQVEAPE